MFIRWIEEKFDDLVYWWKDRPFKRLWAATSDRISAVIFCLLLLIVGIYSPKVLRKVMRDSLTEKH
jgi:fumarate reductase subunit C